MIDFAIIAFIITSGASICAILAQNGLIKRQEKRISDLLDRLMSQNYNDYAVSRERMTVAEKIQAATTNFVDEHGDPDEIRID